ncbi:MAG: class I SAM-dependent methyltransferase [Phycisphaerae bacterium]|nr:class I SAM-dependent methyltransferase [Phycisphaerae bacterium]
MTHPAGSADSIDLCSVPCPLCAGTDHRGEREVRGFRLVRCRDCRMVFANPQPTPEALAAGYNAEEGLAELIGGRPDKVEFYETWFGERDRRRWSRVLARMARTVGKGRLLEYGCGPALVGQLAAEDGWEVEAIDVGAWIRELQPKRSFPLHVGTLGDMDWADGRFDAVYAQDVLEHLQRPLEELAELARLLRPGGVLYVHVPNYASLTIRLGVSRFAYNEPLGHLNYFTPATLEEMLGRAGFERVALRSDHLEYQDFLSRGRPFDYQAFERGISEGGRQAPGRLWALTRGLMNLPLNFFLCGTYLWGYAVRA